MFCCRYEAMSLDPAMASDNLPKLVHLYKDFLVQLSKHVQRFNEGQPERAKVEIKVS